MGILNVYHKQQEKRLLKTFRGKKDMLSWMEAQNWICFKEDVKFFPQGRVFQTLVYRKSLGEPVKRRISSPQSQRMATSYKYLKQQRGTWESGKIEGLKGLEKTFNDDGYVPYHKCADDSSGVYISQNIKLYILIRYCLFC